MPYSVSVKNRMMYAHTFTFEDGMPFTTGCTAVVTATLEGDRLGPYDILIDITVAQRLLAEVCALYDHKNLDTLDEFAGDAAAPTATAALAAATSSGTCDCCSNGVNGGSFVSVGCGNSGRCCGSRCSGSSCGGGGDGDGGGSGGGSSRDTAAAVRGRKRNTTVEVMAKAVHDQLMARLAAHHAAHATSDGKGLGLLTGLRVALEETDVAGAAYYETRPEGFFAPQPDTSKPRSRL